MGLTITCPHAGQTFPLATSAQLPHGFIRESHRYVICYDGPPGVVPELHVGEEPVVAAKTIERPNGIHAEWNWQVDFYAGEVVFVLTQDDRVLLEVILDVAPHPGKLGSKSYEELLSELQEMAEGVLFGSTPARTRLEHSRAESPPMARFSLLHAYLAKLECAFGAIELSPHRRLQALREERSLLHVRRVDRQSMNLALKRMPVLAALTNSNFQDSGPTPRLNVPMREHSFDTSPNRHILSLLLRLKRCCEELAQTFAQHAEELDAAPATVQRMKRWAERANGFRSRVERLIRNSNVLKGLSPQSPDTAALLTVGRHPAYARFDQLARRVLAPAISAGEDADKTLSLRSTYTLYEYWCFFAVAIALRQALPAISWERTKGVGGNQLFLHLTSDLALRADLGPGASLTLSFQECYSARSREDGRPASISRECNPDIVLTYERPAGRKILILDAKYRSARDSIQDGLDDMHVYRDAIRTAGDESAITAAFILTPTHDATAQRYYTEKYRRQFRFGAFDLAPRNAEQLTLLSAQLREFVEE